MWDTGRISRSEIAGERLHAQQDRTRAVVHAFLQEGMLRDDGGVAQMAFKGLPPAMAAMPPRW